MPSRDLTACLHIARHEPREYDARGAAMTEVKSA